MYDASGLIAPTNPYQGVMAGPPPSTSLPPTYQQPQQRQPVGANPMLMKMLMGQAGAGAAGGGSFAGGGSAAGLLGPTAMDSIGGSGSMSLASGAGPSLSGGVAPSLFGDSLAGGGGASKLASFGPWGALAAAIIGNETYQRKHGNRSSDDGEYAKDLLSGGVALQDVKKYTPKWFYDASKWADPIGLLANKIHF